MNTKQLITALGVLVVILAVVAVVFGYFLRPAEVADAPFEDIEIVRFAADGSVMSEEDFEVANDEYNEVLKLGRDGEYAEAQMQIEQILSPDASSNFTLQQIANARHNTIYAYRESAAIEDAKVHVDDLKGIILDESVSLRQRAQSVNSLATAYCGYGRDERVLEHIFSGDFWSDFWKGAPGPSTRAMLDWGYNELMPTPRGATSIAHWYGNQLLMNDELTEEERAEYIERASFYLAEGKRLEEEETRRTSRYIGTRRYVAHLFWRAFTIKALELNGAPVDGDSSEKAYERFFTVVKDQDNHNTYQYLPYANVLLAKFAQIDGKSDAEITAYVREAMRLVREDPHPQANEMAQFLVDIAPHDKGGFAWKAMRDMALYSNEFSTFVSEILEQAKERGYE